MADILEKLMGGPVRVKALRFFLLNPEKICEAKEIALRAKVSMKALKKELNIFKSISLVKQKRITVEIAKSKKKGRGKIKVKRVDGWYLNGEFAYKETLGTLLTQENLFSRESILKKLKPAGKIKLLLVSGIFLQQPESRADLLIVGDNLNKKILENRIKIIESELGRELTYAIFETKEFTYRFNMYDKLIREILDTPHERIVDFLQVETAFV